MNLSSIEGQRAYKKYLKSPHWRSIRESALDRDGHKCCYCGSVKVLQVHHKIYRDTFEQTVLEDVETLCRRCHWREHSTGTQRLDMKLREMRNSVDFGSPLSQQDEILICQIASKSDLEYCVKAVTALFRFASSFRVNKHRSQRWEESLRNNQDLSRRLWAWSYTKYQRLSALPEPTTPHPNPVVEVEA